MSTTTLAGTERAVHALDETRKKTLTGRDTQRGLHMERVWSTHGEIDAERQIWRKLKIHTEKFNI